MSLIKTIEEVKKYVTVSDTLEFDELLPYFKIVEKKYVKQALGVVLYDSLHTAYNAGGTLSEPNSDLVDMVQPVICFLGLKEWVPVGQLNISSSGIRINVSETAKTAFEWQTNNLEGSLLSGGMAALEDLFQFLEDNTASYSSWVNSTGYTLFNECYVRSATEFTEFYSPLNGSRYLFLKLKPQIKFIEKYSLKKLIGTALDTLLRGKLLADDGNNYQKEAIKLIQNGVTLAAIADGLAELQLTFDERGVLIFSNVKAYGTTKTFAPATDAQIEKNKVALKNKADAIFIELRNYLIENKDYFPDYTVEEGNVFIENLDADSSFYNT